MADNTPKPPLICQVAYENYSVVIEKEGKRKTSAKCRGCVRVVQGTNSTTSNYISHTKTAHPKLRVLSQSVNKWFIDVYVVVCWKVCFNVASLAKLQPMMMLFIDSEYLSVSKHHFIIHQMKESKLLLDHIIIIDNHCTDRLRLSFFMVYL